MISCSSEQRSTCDANYDGTRACAVEAEVECAYSCLDTRVLFLEMSTVYRLQKAASFRVSLAFKTLQEVLKFGIKQGDKGQICEEIAKVSLRGENLYLMLRLKLKTKLSLHSGNLTPYNLFDTKCWCFAFPPTLLGAVNLPRLARNGARD